MLAGCLTVDAGTTQTVASICGEPPGVSPVATDLSILGSGSGYLMTPAQWGSLNDQIVAEAEWRTCVLTIDLAPEATHPNTNAP